MAELLALGSAAAAVVSLVKYVTGYGKNEKQPLYTLTPPVFDREMQQRSLVHPPLETYLLPRHRLFSSHFTDALDGSGSGSNLLDVSLHMAPPLIAGTRPSHDFMARIYLPQPGGGGQKEEGAMAAGVRPMADARFHIQHQHDPFSFTDFVLRTEGGGAVLVQGAVNLSQAWKRAQEAKTTTTAISTSPTSPSPSGGMDTSIRQLRHGPQGLSAFFNVPLFGSLHPEGSRISPASRPFRWRSSLLDAPAFGVRYDSREQGSLLSGSSGYSVGLHLNPTTTLHQVRGAMGGMEQVQVSGWVAQETEYFRMSGEGTFAPMQRAGTVMSQAYGPPAAEGAAAAVVSQPPVGPASMIPPSLAARVPLLLHSRVGMFYRDARASTSAQRPNYEVGFTISNEADASAVVGNAAAVASGAGGVRQEFVASYYHHLVVRRNIHNPFEQKQNRAINNYIDLAMEVVYKNEQGRGAGKGDTAAAAAAGPVVASSVLTPPSIRLGASWQLNKNSLLKFRVADSNVSLLAAFKSWWDPSAAVALSVNHAFQDKKTTFGLSVDLENIGEVLFFKPDPSYRRMIASQKERIENQVELDEDY